MSTVNAAQRPSRRAGKKPLRLWAAVVVYIVAAVLVVALVVGNYFASRYFDLISLYLGQQTQTVVEAEGEETQHYVSDFDSDADRQAYLEQVSTDISREGITLLENDGALPLAAGARISVLGQDAVDPVYGGGGAGSIDPSLAVTLGEGLDQAGFEVNPVLWDFYESGPGADFRKTTPDVYGEGAYAVNEVPRALYTDDVVGSFGDYADAAVVVIGRSGGETADLASTSGESGVAYLQLDPDERDMIELATENFDDVIVVLNTSNPLELGFLEEYPISAAVWVGSLGQHGATAVGEALSGVVNPSGALVDTYAYDSLGAPAMANLGSYAITNSDVPMGDTYLAYAEGIYVGYAYYETRYEDVVLGAESADAFDYASEVQYPFGHGDSYTTFAWSGYSVEEHGDAFTVGVDVVNTGETAGKDIVQVYLQSPYTDYDREHRIEKAAVELAGYAKTGLLEPGESATVQIEVPRELMKAYDAYGAGTYILDAGDYYLTAADDAHAAADNILAAKGRSTADGMTSDGDADFAHRMTVEDLDVSTYAVSAETGAAITNQFESSDVRTWDDSFSYLSRSDWTGTWPTTYQDGSWEAPEAFVGALAIPDSQDGEAEAPVFGTVAPAYGELNAAMLIGEEYDSPVWDALLQQASLDELDQLVRIGGYATRGVDSIQLPATVLKDGPAGFSATLTGGDNGMAYPPAIVLASSWNDELAREMGLAIGEDSLSLGYAGWYAPSMNIHRTPYSGRNFEYFSEDGFISGKMGAAMVDGAQDKGVIVFTKHFAVNDQETNRIGGAMLASEQAVRELYLLPFELTVREGGARGMMASMNRLGPLWTGAHPGLVTETLRGEWGFQGVVETDQASFDVFVYEDLRQGLAAGTDLWLNTDAALWKLPDDQVTPAVQADIVRAAHNVAYAVVNSNAMNGLSAGGELVSVTPLWMWGLIAVDVVVGLAIALIVFLVTRRLIRQRREA
ncbi:glycoside hydrolase family 3 protein [Microbacterium marinilacus]|uniref:Glycoside hydrolase family 3 protein n=1 Tax=Microbacterium marinilacus TaxID=415209 RepID=A0ABP7BQW6_9MICO|nr:glycoside hydrolase family 3 protein [Microbacterium marinilacus]MBY0689225.1 glycoside hydrolase family 3 C-terminal domain-containing protein [Microbacterium marinilacus]